MHIRVRVSAPQSYIRAGGALLQGPFPAASAIIRQPSAQTDKASRTRNINTRHNVTDMHRAHALMIAADQHFSMQMT